MSIALSPVLLNVEQGLIALSLMSVNQGFFILERVLRL